MLLVGIPVRHRPPCPAVLSNQASRPCCSIPYYPSHLGVSAQLGSADSLRLPLQSEAGWRRPDFGRHPRQPSGIN